MTVQTQAIDTRPRPVSDAMTLVWRNITALRRTPQYLVFSTVQPVIFVLMFRYVFGGAIRTPGVPYVDYLMPGIFVQTAVFGAMGTGVGLATDLKSGMIERFHSLPMARSAVLAGRTGADLVRNMFVAVLMVVIGVMVGFRIHRGIIPFLAGIVVFLLFGYTLSWIFATVGLLTKDPETAQAASFPLMAPLVFASSAFVPVASMPGWLQPFANHQPVSVTASAVRALVVGGPTEWYVVQSIAWSLALLAIFVPLSVRRYRNAV